MPWVLGEGGKAAQTHPDARQTDAPGQRCSLAMVGDQTASVVETRLNVGWERMAEGRGAGQDTREAELRWAALFARWAAAVGVPFFGPALERQGSGAWLGYARECERERRVLLRDKEKQPGQV
jgi:hypothetical protein